MNTDNFLLWLAIHCFPIIMHAQTTDSYKGIHWRNDLSWNEIKKLAKQEGRNIFVDCYATWCGPCRMMDKQVYTSDSIVDYFNSNFISVKLQMDSTSQDDETVKRWFPLVDQVKNRFGVSEFPTLVFLSAGDTLLDKRVGYLNVRSLLAAAQAIPTKILLHNQLDKYRKGERDYSIMPQLTDFVKNVLGNKHLSNKIANDYKDGYLEKISVDSLFSKNHLEFVLSYPSIIHSQDQLFQIFYQYPGTVDSILKRKAAMQFINWLVTKEELTDKLVKDNRPSRKGNPDWRGLQSIICRKYPKLDCGSLVNDFCITYYRYYKLDWQQWANYKNIKIKKSHMDYEDVYANSMELNNGGAWDVFANCNEKPVLKIALGWIDLANELEKKRQGVPDPACLDTKANLLYKLGSVRNAIIVEQEAIQAALKLDTEFSKSQAKEFEVILAQMKAGVPTYTNAGAIWDKRTLPVNLNNLGSKIITP